VRLDASEILLPAHVLAVDVAEVSNEKGILIADVAGVVVNSLDTALQSRANQLLGFPGAMVFNTTQCVGADGLQRVFQRRLVFFGSGDSRRCHALDSGFQVVDWSW
jgi:hypothetical protein